VSFRLDSERQLLPAQRQRWAMKPRRRAHRAKPDDRRRALELLVASADGWQRPLRLQAAIRMFPREGSVQ
jgi:hypothetical protein